jgi:hypothetical protein
VWEEGGWDGDQDDDYRERAFLVVEKLGRVWCGVSPARYLVGAAQGNGKERMADSRQ